MQGGGKSPSKDRVTANFFFWSSELWSMCWHFLLVAPDNLWMMYMGLLRTWHFLALPVYKAEPHVSARGIFSPTKPANAVPSPIPPSIIDPDNTRISWEVGYRDTGRASEVWGVEKPHGGSHLIVRNLFWGCEWCAVLEELMDFFSAFRKWFCMEEFWKRRQDLSLPKVLLSHAGLWCWDGSQVFGLKPPTKVTVCTVCHKLTCMVPGTGFVTNWVMVRECPDPVSLIFLFKGPPATEALKDGWQRGGKSHRLSRHCWFWESAVLHFHLTWAVFLSVSGCFQLFATLPLSAIPITAA